MCGVAREAYKADDGPGIEEPEPPIYSKLLAAIERGRLLEQVAMDVTAGPLHRR